MTEALYLSDSTLTRTTAKIVESGKDYLILDQTIFYPQGGGQPSDKGVIKSDIAILNVKSVEYNGGNIKHVGSIQGEFKIGDTVTLEIDQALRLKHTQWHTAGHLLDLVAREIYPDLVPVRGMHGIGKKFFIEYEGSQVIDQAKLSEQVNKLISNKPIIKTQFVTLEELKRMANWLPAKLPTSKKLRILSIGDKYHIPDGGTQLHTGDPIWPISVSNIENLESSTLVHYIVEQPQIKIRSNVQSHNDTVGAKVSIEELVAKLNANRSNFDAAISNYKVPEDLNKIYLQYLGRSGATVSLGKELPRLMPEDKKIAGSIYNDLIKYQENLIKVEQEKSLANQNNKSHIDLTIPGIVNPTGHLHPTTVIIREMNEFFRYLGFSIGEGPELEDVEYNFRRLNLPEGHPATDLQDSLFVAEPQFLMRTHTSSVETRMLSEYHNQLPLRVVVPGKCYRNETNSATNTSFFYQYQGFVVDKGITIQHLKDTLTKFHQFLFGDDVKLRFRYKYYPEVSPGMGVDMQCRFCNGAGCSVCKYRGFIEVLGSGMIHCNTLNACGIDPEIYTGYAFGMGLDRLVMSKYGISDIRKLYGGELVYV